jgi:hypothetical protein
MNHSIKSIYISSGFRQVLLRIAIAIAALALASSAHAKNLLDVPVQLDVQNGSAEGVTVSIFKNGVQTSTLEGKKKMNLKLEFNRNYKLVFHKKQYISKSIEFDTHVSSARIEAGFEPYQIGVKLFMQDEENTVVYNQPVAHIAFNKNEDEFSYVTDYSKSVLSELDEIAADVDNKDAEEENNILNKTELTSPQENETTFASGASGIASLEKTAALRSALDNEKAGDHLSSAGNLSGAETMPASHLFNRISVNSEEWKEGNMTITHTTVTKGDVITEYRRVIYTWGGVYYFENNTSSISEEVYALRTNINQLQ